MTRRARSSSTPRRVARKRGKYERLARERQKDDLELGPARGLTFSTARARHAVQFFSLLRHVEGEWTGRAFKLERWQEQDIIRPLFGWEREDGTRRFRIAYIEEPRKNGKSTKAAGIGLYLTVADQEPGAQVYSAATKRDQAKIVHDLAVKMARSSPGLRPHLGFFRNNIHCPRLGSKFEPLGADADTMDGLNPHGVVIDELHAHKTRKVFDVLVSAMGARREPMLVIITTAGIYNPESIGWQMHDYAQKVLEGVIEDDSFFAFIAAADPEDDWRKPATWRKANPNFGVSLKPEYVEQECKRAIESPAYQNTFRRLQLNQWTEQITRWLDMDVWRRNGYAVIESDLLGLPCFGGLDLASTTDITALELVFPTPEGYSLVSRMWIPEDNIRKAEDRDRVPYSAWVRDGFLLTTPGNVTDYDAIRNEINALGEQFTIVEIGYDPWNATELTPKLEAEDGFTMVQMRQGFQTLHGPSKEFERLLLKEALAHGDHPVLNWMAANVAVIHDSNGNIRPAKDKSTGRIDGIVAAIMAIGRAMLTVEERSVYEERGVRAV